ncbi:ATP-binding cassette domain-containing protein [Rhodobacter sphaeroides]|jgi:oligopeptide/dipeptide ABC transporter, ATP-binding protein, C-terminal domain|uniref:ABC di/oligopeptide transporter, ATPase subunit n=1 Tax=Cereibacter sphaeroides (strain ATCC 17023 / DSM 158 / JCM 6121 / CCUG 31486 / LMG 2827 / NBRC 12203 / NCIMB 8253 / ATH 2.4.1.) TaxID=272943 RepID=Q3HKK7_CERS4|nr:ABC transporter ATP-binding protein [Cereibacter sphaeroides]ABA81737.1 ABC di/oligopeptide transporter, ATPase subunit [Cereibacter sphaeroides 2.4.1]AMJ49916.1 peptide ABC transporter ATP-binding protein [Cereibacter sphaeroides]ANS36632.1 peptide ABC transporter ATP-binding protein [Cereibacter sphaeroides]ATN65689.1 peptide ABC transporter ATP-binding protein [Cereibacter sphaeroides]AXC63766.1 ABC transporter ATP-binding protein [Cereibacter sphaeroides 2.4.1]
MQDPLPPLLRVQDLRKEFSSGGGWLGGAPRVVRAVDRVSFDVRAGETLGVVGESGCGKTTLGRMVLRLLEATSGKVEFDGTDLGGLDAARMRAMRRNMQIIFQDPFGALNPRMTVGELIVEPLVIHGVGTPASRQARLDELLDLVGLAPYHAARFAHEFSGGQRQRICIARALALNPRFIVCDEAASALDVSIQAQILNLLQDLKQSLGLTYLFISHDLGVIRHISDRVMVMYLGQVVEMGSKHQIFDAPSHPYTAALLRASPSRNRGKTRFAAIKGDLPSPANPPPGCRFHTRCPLAQPVCRTTPPPLMPVEAPGQFAACHFPGSDRASLDPGKTVGAMGG